MKRNNDKPITKRERIVLEVALVFLRRGNTRMAMQALRVSVMNKQQRKVLASAIERYIEDNS